MPWDIHKSGDKWCVHKKGSSKPIPGGCHDSRAKAVRHQRALYANEPEMKAVTMNENANTGSATGGVSFQNVTISPTMDEIMQIEDGLGNVVGFTLPQSWTFSSNNAPVEVKGERAWHGVLGVIGHPTSDKRYLMPDQISEREFPLPFNVQIVTAEGHDESHSAGRIEEISYIPVSEFDLGEFSLKNVPQDATVIWGAGVLDDSPAADEAERLILNGYGVSLDLPHDRLAIIDPDTFEEIAEEDADMADVLAGKYLTGIGGKIAGATVVNVPAFEEATVRLSEGHALVASAFGMRVVKTLEETAESLTELAQGGLSVVEMEDGARGLVALTAAAAPLKPPREWFDDPGLQKLTPLTITKEGRIFGHLCDWSGCHTGFGSVCVPPFRSPSGYAYFNTGALETAEGEEVAVGKLMFSREGGKHADTDPRLSYQDASKHYDDSTKVGGYVRAGEDRFGTWLAGCVRHDLNDIELQHLKSHPPSGDWRPIPNKGTELIAAFSVPVGGFPIPRALIASAQDGSLVIISAPLDLEMGPRAQMRQRQVLRSRLRAVLSR